MTNFIYININIHVLGCQTRKLKPCKMKHLAVLLCLLLSFERSFSLKNKKDNESVPTYFRKLDKDGKLINRENKGYEDQIPKPFITKILRTDAGAVLKVTPSVIENGGNVSVAWNGVENPTEQDYIALYCPADDKPSHYLDYFKVNVDSRWSQGTGEHSVHVFNMRTSCVFKYFRSGQESQLVAASNPVSFSGGGPMAPLQGHISMTGDPTQMRVMWVSAKANVATVDYGTTEDLGLQEKKFIVNTYAGGDMCESPANDTGFWDPGYIYDVLLTGLEPNTKYYYKFGNEKATSPIRSFRTTLPAGDRTPYKFIAYGDQGIDAYPQGKSTAIHATTDIMTDEDYRFVFHNGDISYALGHAYIWDQWFAMIEPYASRVPYMIGIGNHEYDHSSGGEHDPSGAAGEGFHPAWGNHGDDSHGECGVPMFHRFHMPETGFKLWWYSYDYGMVHYIMISTEHDFSPDSRQYQWLEKDLQSVDRAKTPWIIIGGHRAMYCSSLIPSDYVVSLNMQRLFEDLLHEYKVDLAFWAHYHSYERTCKVYKEECREDGMTHMVIGAAGRYVDPDFWLPKPWSAYHHVDYGYGRMSVVNETAMYWEWVVNSSGEVGDSLWITK